jgi:hypothetical protein
MAKTSLNYEEPSRVSQLLVLAFSVAVAFMAGWLVLTIVLGNGSTMVATADDEVPAMVTKQPPRVENPPVAASPPIAPAQQLLSPQADPGWAGASTGTSPPATAPGAPAQGRAAPAGAALASLPNAPVVAAPATIPAVQSPAPSANDRLPVGDIYAQVSNRISEEGADAPDIVPLPPHRPRTAVPFPRPRPQVAEQTQAQAEPRSFLDIFLNGNR